MLSSFYGIDFENPYKYIDEFLEICSTFKPPNVSDDAIRLRLFPFSLKGKMFREFLQKYFPVALNTLLTNHLNVQSVCVIFSSHSHVISDCPSSMQLQGFHRQNDPYSITYNLGCRKSMTQILDSHTQSIAKLETQIAQLANAIGRRDEELILSTRLRRCSFQTSHEDLDTVFTKIHSQISAIKNSLEDSLSKEKDKAKSNPVLTDICRKVSHLALKIIKEEILRAAKIMRDLENLWGHWV
ncbi:hypothetical protein M9H77_36008 [Catharanthus roseus]|uniref:Uncharacterized protein n=1 Tax=Catharanthus roseus TaxID=4058 RepID=A0ACB9ZSI0_CATRO|nr:hypothetical protein M9H77_36008 [Catharanthus roseus]